MSLINRMLAGRFLSLTIVIGAGMALSACEQKQAAAPEPVRPVKVVRIAPIVATRQIAYSGSVKARREADLGFRVGGKIIARSVDIGDHVEPGAVLARLDTADLDLALKSTAAAVTAAKAQLTVAQSAYDRNKALFDRGFIARATLDDRKLALDQAASSLDSALSSRDQSQNQTEYSELKSDAAGIVTDVRAEAGQVVAAGAPVIVVARDGEKEVAVSVPESEIRYFKTGDRLDVRYWADPGIAQAGTVREIAGSADAISRTFAMRISLPEDGQVRLGMTAMLYANVPVEGAGIVVPLAALTEQAGRPSVWVVDPSKKTVRPQAVVTESFAPDGVRIAGGLQPGDLVVTAGAQFMTADQAVGLDDSMAADIAPRDTAIAAR